MLKVGISLNNEILYSKLKIDTFKTGFPLTRCTAYSHKFSFLLITRKLKLLELRVVISAKINSTILNILSQKPSLYDLQKLRYNFYIWAPNRITCKKGRGLAAKLIIGVELQNFAHLFFI